jgi:hypothetical protein
MMLTTIKQLSTASAIAVGALSATAITARADGPSDPSAIEILGFHLGMTPDEVKANATANVESAVIEVKQGNLSRGTYKSEEMVFGVEVSTGRDKHVVPVVNQEYLYFVFDQRAPYKTISIHRSRGFTLDTAPEMANFKESLFQKYGRPVGSEISSGIDDNMIWTYDSKITYRPKTWGECLSQLGGMDYIGSLRGGQFNPDPVFDKCGTWMKITVRPLKENPQLVGQLDIAINDIRARRETELFTVDMLKKGAEGSAASEKATAASKRAPL